jgi:hypothetical protein
MFQQQGLQLPVYLASVAIDGRALFADSPSAAPPVEYQAKCKRSYSAELAAIQQCFSLTTNQRTGLSATINHRNEQAVREDLQEHSSIETNMTTAL